jgi:hypothetical protein
MKLTPTTEGNQPPRPKKRIFVPSDFWEIIQKVSGECVMVGGQAVAWWALHYRPIDPPLTSCDIDFWGFREDLQNLAKALGRKPVYPHQYEMTTWVGGIPLHLKGEPTIVEFLSSVPGLDVFDPEKASVSHVISPESGSKLLPVLSPVSLVLAKLHALRAYNQTGRQDELHLKVSLLTSRAFISQLITKAKSKQVLWNVERLIAASQIKAYQRLEVKHGFQVLSAVPIQEMEAATTSSGLPEEERNRLQQFMTKRWPRVAGKSVGDGIT